MNTVNDLFAVLQTAMEDLNGNEEILIYDDVENSLCILDGLTILNNRVLLLRGVNITFDDYDNDEDENNVDEPDQEGENEDIEE